MDNHTIIQGVLKEFGKIIDLESLALNQDGSCKLMFDNELEINFELDQTTDSLFLISPVAVGNEKLFADALQLNLFWGELNGCRFILLGNTNVLALMRRIPVERFDLITLETELEKFLETVSVWKQAFENKLQEEQESASTSDQYMQNFMNRV
ncbi:type III secretion system chaperone [Halodesulfovibrio marinisediminis]|uniref:Tir chaperone protein (CesT) family protein n=1 Tax=Halodesulfovibrio marinisediminis DSM 17456 TaxID=1121457 RepID=A0A1N6E1B5_9BACT|nr:type III secretion system chaperone [Halodesulfovibrio marinisediminis]SIN76773.1 Tir chaperone protein (CesT) family protein [Halodesulfovibrio marinisediminis DSM 17456]